MRKYLFLLLVSFICQNGFANFWIVTNTADSGSGSLRQNIQDANAGDTITFSPTLLSGANDTILLNSEITIDKPLVIIGVLNSSDSLYLSGQGSNRIFNIDMSSSSEPIRYMVLDSLCFTGGYHSQLGGAIRFQGDSLYIRNSVFYHNESDNDGGAIHASNLNSGGDCLLEIENSNFCFNQATVRGGSIMTYCPHHFHLRINNAVLSHNSLIGGSNNTDSGGGAVVLRGDNKSFFTMKNSEANNNYSDKYGGAMNLYSGSGHIDIDIDSCQFNNNEAPNLYGGALYINTYSFNFRLINTNLSYTEFKNNIAEQGGAINLRIKDGGHSTFNIDHCSFSENVATVYSGGAISSIVSWSNGGDDEYSTFNIERTTFDNNSAVNVGGAIASTVHTHSSGSYDGESLMNISTSTFTENTAMNKGGAIYNYVYYYDDFLNFPKKAYVDIEKSTFYNNFSLEGGAIYNSIKSLQPALSRVYLKSSIIAENTIPNIINYDTVSASIISYGFNMIGDTLNQGYLSSDSMLVDSTILLLNPLDYYGGPTKTLMPQIGSAAINFGDTLDFEMAQNWNVSDSIRDTGAAEYYCLGIKTDSVNTCSSYTSPSGNYTWTISGVYYDTLFNVNGCDSLIETILTIGNSNQSYNEYVCYGSNFTFPDNSQVLNITDTTIHQSILTSQNGCDSTITITVIPHSVYNFNIQDSVCSGSSYTFPDGYTEPNITQSISHQSNLISQAGCDSTVTTTIIPQSVYNLSIQDSVCSGSSYTFPDGHTEPNITQNMSQQSNLISQAGCDSIVITNLTVQSLDNSVVINGPTITANLTGATYQWVDCNNNFNPIGGASNQSFTPTTSGNYAVVISENGCSDTSACSQINIVGIENFSDSGVIEVYPNPNGGSFELSSNIQEKAIINIYNLNGKLIFSEFIGPNQKLPVSLDVKGGLYLLEVLQNNEVHHYKILIR